MPSRENRKPIDLFRQMSVDLSVPESSDEVSGKSKGTGQSSDQSSGAHYYDGLYTLTAPPSTGPKQPRPVFKRDDILQALDLFFSTLLQSEGVTDATRSLLVILRSSIVKAALQNSEFLVDARHPARRLIKIVVATSQTVVPIENYTRDEVYIKMHAILCSLSKSFARDERVFLQAYFEINNLEENS